MRQIRSKYIVAFTIVLVGYLVALYTLPPEASTLTRYNLSPTQARTLSLSVAVPLLLIWSLGLFGLLRVSEYARKIRKDRDGKSFLIMSQGLTVLVFGLPFQALLNTVISHMTRRDPDLIPTGVITMNYLLLGVILASFYLIHKGAQSLVSNVKNKSPSNYYLFWRFLFVVFSVAFIYFTLNNPARQAPVDGVAKAVYYLPDWLIVATIVLPYIAVWYLGIQSAYSLRRYLNQVPGVLYKRSLSFLSNGVAAVILASMLQRFLSSLTVFFSKQELKILLIVLYLLILVISVGYILIAIGASKLSKIEDV